MLRARSHFERLVAVHSVLQRSGLLECLSRRGSVVVGWVSDQGMSVTASDRGFRVLCAGVGPQLWVELKTPLLIGYVSRA